MILPDLFTAKGIRFFEPSLQKFQIVRSAASKMKMLNLEGKCIVTLYNDFKPKKYALRKVSVEFSMI